MTEPPQSTKKRKARAPRGKLKHHSADEYTMAVQEVLDRGGIGVSEIARKYGMAQPDLSRALQRVRDGLPAPPKKVGGARITQLTVDILSEIKEVLKTHPTATYKQVRDRLIRCGRLVVQFLALYPDSRPLAAQFSFSQRANIAIHHRKGCPQTRVQATRDSSS